MKGNLALLLLSQALAVALEVGERRKGIILQVNDLVDEEEAAAEGRVGIIIRLALKHYS